MAAVSLKDKAYKYIKDKIVCCEYLPGQVLVEAEIIEAVGASRTPIREALNKLEQERLVRIIAKRGVFVSDITVATISDVYDVRELVEPYFVEKIGPHIPIERIDELCSRVEQDEKSEMVDQQYLFDNDFHQMFISYSSNTYLEMMMEQVYAQNNRIRILSGWASQRRLDESRKEHKEILDAMKERDFGSAANAMRNHLQISREAALEATTHANTGGFLIQNNIIL
ncbi:GntR family transcriptional regulator [Ruminococcaceae bacterium OttesenSCG-928-A16]|nr:GntR family transcriptional regulator [Ruminococcaceae bacterium OttesenSCG-928-A16]